MPLEITSCLPIFLPFFQAPCKSELPEIPVQRIVLFALNPVRLDAFVETPAHGVVVRQPHDQRYRRQDQVEDDHQDHVGNHKTDWTILWEETRTYVPAILKLYEKFQQQTGIL